jgi:hypothetical protein
MGGDESSREESARMAELEAKAVAEATATADDSFMPSPSLLNASSPQALLQQVDGPSLSGYEAKESVYVGKSVPVALRGKMEVPIHVTAPGSIVEFAIESKAYDISFSVVAEREEGITVVKVSSSFTYSLTTGVHSTLYSSLVIGPQSSTIS